MLFNSYSFIFGFFPLTLVGFFLLGRHKPQLAIPWLAVASIAFYTYWDWRFLFVFAWSITTNYTFGRALARCNQRYRSGLLAIALATNLLLLGYYKYSNFLLEQLSFFCEASPKDSSGWALPLGISFFTFTQIAYLVDVYRGKAKETNFWHYLLFVSYFPHLIAGPVLHHAQIMPQFAAQNIFRPQANNIALGATIFSIGLAKKVLFADTLAIYAEPVFQISAHGGTPGFIEAWTGALAYTLQLYFDFSGYSDMAIGLSLMFNIRLPINFYSPYRATSIIEFWRRWHITLSCFLRDYLYIPLGGNKQGKLRRYTNLMITMLLGGLWHGAGWTFVLWGALHGTFLMINHAWRSLTKGSIIERLDEKMAIKLSYMAITFLCVTIGWVVFRADSLPTAAKILTGMVGGNGLILPEALRPYLGSIMPSEIVFGNATALLQLPLFQAWSVIFGCLITVFFLPNISQWMARAPITYEQTMGQTCFPSIFIWSGNIRDAMFTGLLFGIALLSLNRVSEFLYFQF